MKRKFNSAVKILSLKELRILPSYLSYNFVLALIPAFTIIVLIASFFSISLESIKDLISNIMPSYIENIIINIISSKNYDLSLGLFNLLTLYASSRGIYSIIEVSNDLYNVRNNNAINNRLKSFLILFLFIFSLLFLIIIPILGEKIIYILDEYNFVTKRIVILYNVFKWPFTFLVIYYNIKAIYLISPSIKLKSEDVVLGCIITTIGWSLFTFLFGYYLNYFGKYDLIYGSLSSILVLLIWIYALSYILVLGIVINTRKYNKE